MREDFLSYIWLNKLIDVNNLKTVKGVPIKIINSGSLNTDAGPDIFNAKLSIGDLVWAGNIEIHVLASDWYKHKHQNDPNYNSIILHLVYDYDTEIVTNDGRIVACLPLKGKFDMRLFRKFAQLKRSTNWIPCEKSIDKVSELTWINCKDKMLVERLERKAKFVEELYHKKQQNWEETFYCLLAKTMGMKTNALAFEMLFDTISFAQIKNNAHSLFQVDTLLFGQSGMLHNPIDHLYHELLRDEYNDLNFTLQLRPMDVNLWKFHRMRPANFPTIRLAQLAYILSEKPDFFERVISYQLDINDFLEDVSHSNYWAQHYTFKDEPKPKMKFLGQTTIDHIVINCITPFLFHYGKQNHKPDFVDSALDYLQEIKSEKNSIIHKWKGLSVNCESAFDSQALIQLKNEYCDKYKCLRCVVGNEIIRHH